MFIPSTYFVEVPFRQCRLQVGASLTSPDLSVEGIYPTLMDKITSTATKIGVINFQTKAGNSKVVTIQYKMVNNFQM